MNMVVLVGDSLSGKTVFAHVGCRIEVPMNVFRSTQAEVFYFDSTGKVIVVPGTASDEVLSQVCDNADGVMILYTKKQGVPSALKWLRRLENTVSNLRSVPMLICHHKQVHAGTSFDRRHTNMLTRYANAEHADTSVRYTAGTVDCFNRVFTRIRRQHPSPLVLREGAHTPH